MALASAAHALKTPLAVLNGYADLLLDEKLGTLNPKQRDVLVEMQATRMRLQHFTEDFLNEGAIATGKLKLRIDRNDINQCLNDICAVWYPWFQEKLIAFYRVDGTSLEPFPFDYYKVQHIISNLLHNALKFTPAKRTVWIAAEPHSWERRSSPAKISRDRRKRRDDAPNSVRVTVSDAGPGISPEYHMEIFEDFARAQADQSRSHGSGLGLAVARTLVQAHGGEIWVESEHGMGSKFCFLLPFKRENTLEGERA